MPKHHATEHEIRQTIALEQIAFFLPRIWYQLGRIAINTENAATDKINELAAQLEEANRTLKEKVKTTEEDVNK